MKKLLLTGGGTAGHVTPNIAMLPLLRKKGYDVAYIGSYNGIEKKLITEQNVPYYNFNKARLSVLDRSDLDYGDKEGHMGGELAEEYSEVLAEVLKGHFNGTLDETKYFYNTFDEMYKEMEEQ